MAMAVCPFCGHIVYGYGGEAYLGLQQHYRDMAAGQTASGHPKPRAKRPRKAA